MVAASVRPPGVSVMRFAMTSSTTATGRPFEQRDALAQRGLERDLAAHRALGDRRDMRLQPDIVGKLVDAFLLDDGRNPCRRRTAACAGSASGCTTTSIGWSFKRGTQPHRDRFVVRAARRKGNVGGDAGVEDANIHRGREHADRERDRRVVERGARGIGDESGDVKSSGTGKGGAYRRADRERQVGARAGACRRARRHDRQCRLDAGLSRPARHHGAAGAGARRRGCRTGSTAMWMRRRTIRSGAGSRMSRPVSTRCVRRGACRSWSAAPGSISRR